MGGISRRLSLAAMYASAAGLVAMTLIICWQVFARYVLHSAPAWTEQSALYLMLWFIIFAAAAGVREGFHIRLSLLQDMASPGWRKGLRLTSHGVVLVFGLFMAVSGGELVAATWQHDIPTLGLPRGSAYLPIPISGALIVFFCVEHILTEWQGREVEPLWN